jgi:hypothetical protein
MEGNLEDRRSGAKQYKGAKDMQRPNGVCFCNEVSMHVLVVVVGDTENRADRPSPVCISRRHEFGHLSLNLNSKTRIAKKVAYLAYKDRSL